MRCKNQHRIYVARGSHGLFQCSEPGYRKVQRRTCVTRGNHGFLRNLDTGPPESSAPHLRYARQPWFPPRLRHRDTGKFSAALALREATTVSSATSTPGYRKVQCRTCVTRGSHGFLRTLEPGHRNMRIRRCVNSPLKLLCSGGRGRFRGLRPWSASSSAGTWCLRPP